MAKIIAKAQWTSFSAVVDKSNCKNSWFEEKMEENRGEKNVAFLQFFFLEGFGLFLRDNV